MTPEAFNVTTSGDDMTWTIDRYTDGGLQPWGTVEQGPTGEWWVTSGATGSTTGPYLDEVQAMRVLQAWEGS